jgi:hypothetical protein
MSLLSLLLLLALLVDREHHRWLPTVSILISFRIGQQATQLCHIHVIRNPLRCKQSLIKLLTSNANNFWRPNSPIGAPFAARDTNEGIGTSAPAPDHEGLDLQVSHSTTQENKR